MERTVLLVLVAVSVSAASAFWPELIAKARSSRMEAVLRSSMTMLKADVGIDPAKCTQDLETAASPQFEQCASLIESSLTDISHFFDYSNTEAAQFCASGCPTRIVTLLNKMKTDCGIDPTQIPAGVLTFVPLLCYNSTIINHDTCLQTWKHLEDPTVLSNYQNCIDSFTPDTACPDSCKTAVSWVETNVGCCYKELEDFSNEQPIHIMNFLSQDIWEACDPKGKGPSSCHCM